jgi:hypothetical protein
MLVEFASMVDALRCAVEVQRGMAERNAEVPQDERIEFRVGIHQGDIIIARGDIFGDGSTWRRVWKLWPGASAFRRGCKKMRGKLELAFSTSHCRISRRIIPWAKFRTR